MSTEDNKHDNTKNFSRYSNYQHSTASDYKSMKRNNHPLEKKRQALYFGHKHITYVGFLKLEIAMFSSVRNFRLSFVRYQTVFFLCRKNKLEIVSAISDLILFDIRLVSSFLTYTES